MLGVVATLKVKPGMEKQFEAVARELVHGEAAGTCVFLERYVDQAAVEAHRASEHFRSLGRKMGEFMDGRPEVQRLREVE
jgi:quinol monooxygenase YgiN